jgi:hypothetical protein
MDFSVRSQVSGYVCRRPHTAVDQLLESLLPVAVADQTNAGATLPMNSDPRPNLTVPII